MIFAVEMSITVYPPLFPLLLNLMGRDSLCTPSEVFRGAQAHQSALRDGSIESLGIRPAQAENGFQLLKTGLGDWWVPEGNDQFLPDLLSQQENDLYGSGENGVQPGDVVLDCGAHIGLFTRKALDKGASVVVAIEISPPNIECLKRNFKEEILDGRVVVYPKGVWDKDDFLTLYSGGNSAGDSVVISELRSAVETKVPLTTIDKLVGELELSKVDFVKMDIKGAAVKALQGAQSTLRANQPRMAIATEEKSDHPVQVVRAVSAFQLGYDVRCGACTASPNLFSWRELLTTLRGYQVYPLVLFFSPPDAVKSESPALARKANQ